MSAGGAPARPGAQRRLGADPRSRTVWYPSTVRALIKSRMMPDGHIEPSGQVQDVVLVLVEEPQ